MATRQEEKCTRRREVARATDPSPGATAKRNMHSSRLEATQSLSDATARILHNHTEAGRAAMDRISNPREPHIVKANSEMMLANLIQLEPEQDWVERSMERVFTYILLQNADAAQL
jgi:hypothetical protein